MEYEIIRIIENNWNEVNQILINEWEATIIIITGKIIDGTKLDGFIAIK